MRNAFLRAVMTAAKTDTRITILSGDLGYTVFEDFITHHPNQFINMGVGEANMMSIAAGMAAENQVPITYSIIPFITMRCYEQIRNDVCSHKANVKIVGVGSGLGYAHLGISHHAAEDIAIMRVLPNMTVLSPADSYEVLTATKWMLQHTGPVYLRLGKRGEPHVHAKRITQAQLRKGIILQDGNDGVIFATGTLVYNAKIAAEQLAKKNIHLRVISVPCIKPLHSDLYSKIIPDKPVFTVEEHSIIGGLGSAIAELILANDIPISHFRRIGINDTFCRYIGTYKNTRNAMGLSISKITTVMQQYFRS